jgi:phosphate-selective porin
VGVNWYWNKFAKVQFNWIRSMPDYIGYGAAPFDIYGTRFQIEF